jgi:hypothetical protein
VLKQSNTCPATRVSHYVSCHTCLALRVPTHVSPNTCPNTRVQTHESYPHDHPAEAWSQLGEEARGLPEEAKAAQVGEKTSRREACQRRRRPRRSERRRQGARLAGADSATCQNKGGTSALKQRRIPSQEAVAPVPCTSRGKLEKHLPPPRSCCRLLRDKGSVPREAVC